MEDDVISSTPENVLTDILDRLPIQDAVRTSILSRNWRFKWTFLTELVFIPKFSGYERVISKLFLHLQGPITKFVLRVPNDKVLEDEYINHWVMYLSRKGIKEFRLINKHEVPLKLPTHLSSCLDLKHLKLRNCSFHPAPTFRGFPNLLTLDLNRVTFVSWKCGEVITQCPLLEILKISKHGPTEKLKLVEIAKLKDLKVLSLPLRQLDNIAITSSIIFQLGGYLSKLQELYLDFQDCKFRREPGARKWVCTAFPCLKTLSLFPILFTGDNMLSNSFEMIWGSPNLQTLTIKAAYLDDVPPPSFSCPEVDIGKMRQLPLRSMVLKSFRGSEKEVYLIKSLLAYSPLLRNIDIHANSSKWFGGHNGKLTFAKTLFTLHQASPIAERPEIMLYNF